MREDQATGQVHREVARVATPEQGALDLGRLRAVAVEPRREQHRDGTEPGLHRTDEQRVAKLAVVGGERIPFRRDEAELPDAQRAVGDRPAEVPAVHPIELGVVARRLRGCDARREQECPEDPHPARLTTPGHRTGSAYRIFPLAPIAADWSDRVMRNLLLVAASLGLYSQAVAEPNPIETHKEERIHVDQKIVPIQMTKLLSDPGRIPPYSDEAKMGNVWVRAWVWLDVDDTGKVQRVKFINRPGHDLDQIAIDWAMSREFFPAVNQWGHAVHSIVFLPIEWPSYYWLMSVKHSARRLPGPADLTGYAVEGDGGGYAGYPAMKSMSKLPPCTQEAGWVFDSVRPHVTRDCSKPDLSHASAAEPWYDRKH